MRHDPLRRAVLAPLPDVHGDHAEVDAAEPLYRRALDIFERIGDQADTATGYANLGSLSEALGNLDQAVDCRVRALAIRFRIGTATAGDVEPLAGLRRQLGRDRFRAAAVASGLDEQSVGNLMEILEQHEKPIAGNWPAIGPQAGPDLSDQPRATEQASAARSGRAQATDRT